MNYKVLGLLTIIPLGTLFMFAGEEKPQPNPPVTSTPPALQPTPPPVKPLASDLNVVRLINANAQHDFIFRSEPAGEGLKVILEISNVPNAIDSALIKSKTSAHGDHALNIQQGMYQASGRFRLDEVHGVIRFTGNLRLQGVAEARFDDSPVLAAY